MTKEYFANLTSRTDAIAENILAQLNGTTPNFNGMKFLYRIAK